MKGAKRTGKSRTNLLKRKWPHSRWLWNICKARSKRKNIEFDISIDDIIMPNRCPILGVKLIKSEIGAKANSATIDRINPNKGYTKENIIVISHLANRMKSNANHEQIEKLYRWSCESNKKPSRKSKK